MLPLLRHFGFGKNGVNRTGRNAAAAVDALLGIDVEHLRAVETLFVLPGMDAIHGADVDAGPIAKVKMPYRIIGQIHGFWTPGHQLPKMKA